MQEPSLPHSVFANRLSQTKLFTEPQKNKLQAYLISHGLTQAQRQSDDRGPVQYTSLSTTNFEASRREL